MAQTEGATKHKGLEVKGREGRAGQMKEGQ